MIQVLMIGCVLVSVCALASISVRVIENYLRLP
jgi:hypothetical protein